MKKCACLVGSSSQVFFLFAVLCFLLFTNINCKKDKLPIDQLPAATQIGKGTFGCLANGQALTPTIKFIYNSNFSYGYDPSYGFSVDAANENNDNLRQVKIQLQIKNLTEGQTYMLNEYNVAGKGGAEYNVYYNSGQHSDYYETNNLVNGTITITKLDSTKKIISGLFAFKAVNSSNGEIVNVTDGRFDLTF